MTTIKEPVTEEELGVKIGSKKESLWTQVKDTCLKAIEGAENELAIQKEILALAERIIKEEKEKFIKK